MWLSPTVHSWLKPWTPYSVGGMWFWGGKDPEEYAKNFSDSLVSPDEPVGRWLDQSGNGHDARQEDKEEWCPIYRDGSDGFFSGYPYLEFDGKNDVLYIKEKLDQPVVVMMVLHVVEWETDHAIFDGGIGSDLETFGYMILAGAGLSPNEYVIFDGQPSDPFVIPEAQTVLGEFWFDGVNSKIYINGVLVAIGELYTDPPNGFTLGNVANPSYDFYSKINVPECFIFQKSGLTAADASNLRRYLNNKYQIY